MCIDEGGELFYLNNEDNEEVFKQMTEQIGASINLYEVLEGPFIGVTHRIWEWPGQLVSVLLLRHVSLPLYKILVGLR